MRRTDRTRVVAFDLAQRSLSRSDSPAAPAIRVFVISRFRRGPPGTHVGSPLRLAIGDGPRTASPCSSRRLGLELGPRLARRTGPGDRARPAALELGPAPLFVSAIRVAFELVGFGLSLILALAIVLNRNLETGVAARRPFDPDSARVDSVGDAVQRPPLL